MKVHEYQAKEILKKAGVSVPAGFVALTPTEAKEAAKKLEGQAVVKAQVHAGGRGKGGGIRLANSPEEAEEVAGQLLGQRLTTPQTGPEGLPVSAVLVEQTVEVERELYLSILVDGSARMPAMIASEAGGMEIEEVAASSPEKILRVNIDPFLGIQPYQARRLAYGMNLKAELVRPATALMTSLYEAFVQNDCALAEINPLVVTRDGRLLALDAKLTFDDDALFRHPELGSLRDSSQEDPMDAEASSYDVSYVRLDGEVGCMVNGAGLAMATMDVIKLMGSSPANFLDVGGGASEEQVANAFKLLLSDPKVKHVLVNLFGGILRCDVAARGIVKAATEKGGVNVPLIARLRGTNAEEGRQILAASGLTVNLVNDLREVGESVAKA